MYCNCKKTIYPSILTNILNDPSLVLTRDGSLKRSEATNPKRILKKIIQKNHCLHS